MSALFSKLTWVDYLTAITFLWGAYAGYRAGFFAEILKIAGYAITGLVTLYLKEGLAQYLTLKTFLNTASASAVAFFSLLILVFVLTRLLTVLIVKILKLGEGGFGSRILGLLIGASRWLVILSLAFMCVDALPLVPLQRDIHGRSVAGPKVAKITPLIFDFVSGLAAKRKEVPALT